MTHGDLNLKIKKFFKKKIPPPPTKFFFRHTKQDIFLALFVPIEIHDPI